jgi:hypothetical protein
MQIYSVQRDKSWRNPGLSVYNSSFAVFQPFLRRLITANVKFSSWALNKSTFLSNFSIYCEESDKSTFLLSMQWIVGEVLL